MDIKEFLPPIRYGANVGNDITNDGTGVLTLTQGSHFIVTTSVGTITSWYPATGVTLLADSAVTDSRSVYVEGAIIRNSPTAWTSGGTLSIEDSSGTAFLHYGFGMEANQNITIGTGSGGSSFVLLAPFYNGTSGTASKGLVCKYSGGTATAGNTFKVTVWGVIK